MPLRWMPHTLFGKIDKVPHLARGALSLIFWGISVCIEVSDGRQHNTEHGSIITTRASRATYLFFTSRIS